LIATLAKGLGLAYLLPSSILLHQMAVRQSEELPPTFAVSGSVTLAGDAARGSAAELGLEAHDPLTVAVEFEFSPGSCRLRVQGSRPVSLIDDHGQVGAATLPWAAQIVRLGCLPFLFRGEQGGDSLEATLRRAGGNFEEAALTLEHGAVSYVVGAGEGGSGPAGLQIKKRDLVPLRIWQQEGGARIEVAFDGYREVFLQGGFPTVLQLRVNGAPIARFSAGP
jgi:hypothetical protein